MPGTWYFEFIRQSVFLLSCLQAVLRSVIRFSVSSIYFVVEPLPLFIADLFKAPVDG